LVIGFIDHLQILTKCNYKAFANSCTCPLTTRTKSSQFSFTYRFLVTDPDNVLCLRPYWLANVPRSSHCSNYLTRRLAAISYQPPTLLTTVSTLGRNRSWSSLYSLGTDRTENTASNSSSFAACASVAAII
jgi:hypothetical protein